MIVTSVPPASGPEVGSIDTTVGIFGGLGVDGWVHAVPTSPTMATPKATFLNSFITQPLLRIAVTGIDDVSRQQQTPPTATCHE
ncbi:MAG: hypothetical protein R2689_01685 [Microthrixaceae bacterium]